MSCAPRFLAACLRSVASLLVVLLVSAGNAVAAEAFTILEITGADQAPSFENDAAWGWWHPGKYDVWEADEKSSFDLAELRLMIPGVEYSVFVNAELYPEIEGFGQQVDDEGALYADHELTAEIEVYDLAYGQEFHYRGGDMLRPWLGLTHMQISERRILHNQPTALVDRADSKLWGAVLGLDLELVLPYELVLSTRLQARWATGDRDASFIPETSYGLPDATQVKASDSVNRAMWGAEMGVRWQGLDMLGFEGGYRIRDWSYDDGPGSFDGPYLRLILKL